MKKRIVLCADDYGQAPAVSQGILALVKDGRLSAVSCMVTSSYWQEHAVWLKPFLSQIDIGLHVNLTEGKSSLFKLMLKAILRQLDGRALVAELNAQMDAFEEAMGCLPRFIDGHQHVHQFPVVREALLTVYKQRLQSGKPYIRVINGKTKLADYFLQLKLIVTKMMGTNALTRLLVKHQIPHNQSFSGMYSFANASNYAKHFAGFLDKISNGGLIMCHPGLPSSLPNDPIAIARYFEYQYLSGLRFKMDCDAKGVAIGRFS